MNGNEGSALPQQLVVSLAGQWPFESIDSGEAADQPEPAEAFCQRIANPMRLSASRSRSRPFIDLIGPRRLRTLCVHVPACIS